MAAAMATKVLRAGRSGGSSSSLTAAMCRRVPQEGVATGAPLLGSSPAAHTARASRLMHSGQCHNSMVSGGNGSKLAEQKALLFGTRGLLHQELKNMRSGQFSSGKRFMSNNWPFGPDRDYLAWLFASIYGVMTVGFTLPIYYRWLLSYLKEE